MRTLLLILACVACCVTAGHFGLGQKQGTNSQRQQFLLDILLQLQKPLVNTKLIQMGEVLVTDPNMYTEPNDVILQEFLQLASNQRILGRHDVYNPVDMKTLRQLVGLKHFFLRSRDFQIFQQNVVYARLYFNAVMFVDALTLALRERPDTQDLGMAPMNEILPELYYDNSVLYSAINVNFDELVNQVSRNGRSTGIFGFFGGLLPRGDKYIKPWLQRRMQSAGVSVRDQFGLANQAIPAKVVVPVEQQDDRSSVLTNDIQLDVAWRNILIDQLAQTALEGIYQQRGKETRDQQGVYYGAQQFQEHQKAESDSARYGDKRPEYAGPYEAQKFQEHQKAEYSPYGPHIESHSARYGDKRPEYAGPYEAQQLQEHQKAEYLPYGTQRYQATRYGSQILKDQEYDPSYTGIYEGEEYQGAMYDSKDKKYGSYYVPEYQKAEYGPYGTQSYQGAQYGAQTTYTGAYGRNQNEDLYEYKKQEVYAPSRNSLYGGRPTQGGAQYGYTARNPYEIPNRGPQAFKPSGQEHEWNNRDMPMSNDEDNMMVLNRGARHAHEEQEREKGKRSDEHKLDSKRKGKQYGNDVITSSESAPNITYASKVSHERSGEILLQSIQELAARINIERIVESLEGQQQQQYYEAERAKIAQLMQLMRTLIEQVREESSISKNSEATLNLIADIINGRFIFEQKEYSITVQNSFLALQQQIADIRGYPADAAHELIPLALFYGNLREPLTHQIIISCAELIAEYRQQLQPYTKEKLIANIELQNVQITPLITYEEYYDADLINLIDEQLLQSNTNNLQRLSQKVVARQQRLNHEPFTISMVITVEQPQEIAVRVLLVPNVDNNGRIVSLSEYAQNFIVLDTFVESLQSGKNLIQRSSRQFNGYINDVTTMSQLYRQIMSGKIPQQAGSIGQLPRNLLLPRGVTVNGRGLPVQILVIATPLTEQNQSLSNASSFSYPQQISGFGISSVGEDHLPLGYPLDRQTLDMKVLNISNVQLIETEIQYDNSIRG